MILMGDEVRRTQGGNNNGYCHDDESAWFDWTLLEAHADVHRFVRLLLARRVLRDVAAERARLSLAEILRGGNWTWHGVRLGAPDWRDVSHSLALAVSVPREGLSFHMMFNAYWEPLEFELPAVPGGAAGPWRRWIDTSLDSPQDISEWDAAPAVAGDRYRVESRTVVLLSAGAA
jgi:glycogen operon protein